MPETTHSIFDQRSLLAQMLGVEEAGCRSSCAISALPRLFSGFSGLWRKTPNARTIGRQRASLHTSSVPNKRRFQPVSSLLKQRERLRRLNGGGTSLQRTVLCLSGLLTGKLNSFMGVRVAEPPVFAAFR
jgi:hypothetical protein